MTEIITTSGNGYSVSWHKANSGDHVVELVTPDPDYCFKAVFTGLGAEWAAQAAHISYTLEYEEDMSAANP